MPSLKGNKSFYEYEISDAVATNLKGWLDYGLLEMGAFTRVEFSNPQTSGYTNLQKVNDDRYTYGQVHEGFGPSWVWESGVSTIKPSDGVPFIASGVQVGSTFYSTVATSGAYSHNIDFKTGRVIFDSPVLADVKCQYTFRDVAIYLSDSPEFKTMVDQYDKNYNYIEDLAPSGMAQILKENRVWLPSVVIEIRDRTSDPLQLGGGEIANFEVDYHVFTDKPFAAKRLSDLLGNQYEQVLSFYDANSVKFPYNYDGTIASGATPYPILADRSSPYFWTYARIKESSGGTRQSKTDVYRAEITQTVSVDRYLSTY